MAGNDVWDAASRIFGLLSGEEQRKHRLAAMMDRLQSNGWVERRPPLAVQGPAVADAASAFNARLAAKDSLRTEAERQIAGQMGLDSGASQVADERGRENLTGHGDDDPPTETPEEYPLPPQKPEMPASFLPPIPPLKPELDPLADWPELSPPLSRIELRGLDGYGEGRFGQGLRLDENGDPRPHWGMDLAADPGTPVYAPIAGIFRIGDPYGNDPRKRRTKKSVRLEAMSPDGETIERIVRLFYVEPDSRLSDGQHLEPGTFLGRSQDLQDIYPPLPTGPMTNHVHVQIERPVRKKLNPMSLLDPWSKRAERARKQRQLRLERIEQGPRSD